MKIIEANFRISFRSMSQQKMLSILYAAGAGYFVKLIFFMAFSSVPGLRIDSSVNLGMSTFFCGLGNRNGEGLLPTHGDYYVNSQLLYRMGEPTEVFIFLYLVESKEEGKDGEAKTRKLGPIRLD